MVLYPVAESPLGLAYIDKIRALLASETVHYILSLTVDWSLDVPPLLCAVALMIFGLQTSFAEDAHSCAVLEAILAPLGPPF